MEPILTSRSKGLNLNTEVFNEGNFRPAVRNTVTKCDINCLTLYYYFTVC